MNPPLVMTAPPIGAARPIGAAAPRTTQAAPDRFPFSFSDNGRYGVWLRATDEDRTLESWTFGRDDAVPGTTHEVAAGGDTRALPLDDGRILLLQRDGGRHGYELALLAPGGARRRLGEIPAPLGAQPVASRDPADLGFVVALDDAQQSTIWQVSASAPRLTPLLRVPGILTGGGWLDDHLLVLNQAGESCRSSGIVVDVAERSWRRIWSVSDTSVDRIVLASPRSGLFVVTTNATGEERLGWGRLGERTVRFPETLHRPGYLHQALTFDDRGERLMVHEVAGATSRLLVHAPTSDRLEPLAGPAGTISAPASWTGDVIRFRFSAPDRPPALTTVRLGTESRWSLRPDREAGWAHADLVDLPGPAGPIEAIVYGRADWRQSRHLVVALHGGPLSAWRYEFDPLFQQLASAGVAVVAPNQRGSTGYGDEHLRAVIGHWGGPDLEDVLHLGRSLGQARSGVGLPKPVVLGASYGAFLALLSACQDPALWSACVALAPLLSGPRLYRCADATARHRIEQLGGLTPIDDHRGPRDILRACGTLSAPLLLVHGNSDRTIPVEQSRTLRRRLLELGRTEGVDFEYLEVDGDHDDVVRAQRTALPTQIVRFCLSAATGWPGR